MQPRDDSSKTDMKLYALTDPRIEQLCREIIESQEREIREMKALMQDSR